MFKYILLCSALHIAAKSGLVRVVKELLKRGTNLKARDCDGKNRILIKFINLN